MEEHIQ